MHILVADDDKDDYYFLKEAADRTGKQFTLLYAANLLELWRSVQKSLPDALFLDLNMPVKNGIECLQLLRNDRKYDTLPILIYSTSVSKNDIDKSYQNGANYFIVKPNDLDDITEILKKIYFMSKDALLAVPSREAFIIM